MIFVNADKVLAYMKANKIRAEALATMLGCSYNTVRNILRGLKPEPVTLNTLASLMKVTPSELLVEVNPPEKKRA